MLGSYKGYRLLLVHAHPDDETINNGATMAMYTSLGAEVTLVTCTRGEEGEVLVPDLLHLSSVHSDSLGEHRMKELDEAMKILGVADHRFLGEPHLRFRDSGMMDTLPNTRPDVFWQANLEDASDLLVKIIDEVKPHVMVTYDEIGGYGHPDHIQAHRIAMRASEKSQWKISKIYWNAMPRSVIARGIEKMKEIGSDFFGAESINDIPFAKDDSLVTTVVNGISHVNYKVDAMKAHATQIEVDGPFFALSNNLGLEVWADEYYSLVHGEKGLNLNSDGRETDLFDGVKVP